MTIGLSPVGFQVFLVNCFICLASSSFLSISFSSAISPSTFSTAILRSSTTISSSLTWADHLPGGLLLALDVFFKTFVLDGHFLDIRLRNLDVFRVLHGRKHNVDDRRSNDEKVDQGQNGYSDVRVRRRREPASQDTE